MADTDFVHLHVHSEYSLLDGANRIKNLVRACQDDKQRALALTDHGNMFGAIELYQECMSADIKPIIGCEVYVARRSRHESHSKKKGNGYNHLTLLARNEEGFRNLIKLASLAYTEGYSFRPRVDKEILNQYAGGITCLSGCLAGEISQLFMAEKEAEAEKLATEFRDLFGPEHFWLELQRNGIKIQDTVNESMVRLHQRTGIPLVATNDIHYLRAEDCHAQDVLLCINTGAKRADEKRFRFDTQELFFRTRGEMSHMFRDLPDSVSATMDVAEQCELDIEFGKYHVPVFKDEGGRSPDELLQVLLEEGLARVYPEPAMQAKARERLEYEQGIIKELGFVSYFLIVWDLILWARKNGISVGPGRGSAAGSIVAYLLDITRVCPLKYDLLFERFLNKSRVSMPDIDIDFCKEGRERVIQYTRDKYGSENVAQIVTFGTMASRTVVRDVGRVLDLPLSDINRIAKKIPSGPGAPTLAEALKTDPDLKEIRAESDQFDELFRLSVPLEGMARHISTHAAGVIIADKPIVEYVPLALNGDDITTQWPAPQLEELGLLKMDYLGLRTLTIIDRAIANITKLGGTPPDITDLPDGDPATYKLLLNGDTLGVFQLESEGMRKLLTRIKPDCFEDLIAILALYRPGPLESGMVEMFIRRKHGEEAIVYEHECLEDILGDTYGCIVYQEQVMLISNKLGSFSLNEADNLRKAMGKKKPEIMQKFSAQFVEGAVANGCDRDTAQGIWDNIVKFGGYGFNKSHSTAYAMITYQTAYLKANHRVEFLSGNMSCEMGDTGKVKDFVEDCRSSGIEILPPCAKTSVWEFEPGEDRIRYGLGAIKGTGQKSIEVMLEGRDAVLKAGKTLTLHNLCGEIEPALIGRGALEAIVKAGSFDYTGHNRGAVFAAVDGAMADGTQAARDRKCGQSNMFMDLAPAPSTGDANRDDGVDSANAWEKAETLASEFEVLGFYLSGHPLEERAGLLNMISTVRMDGLHEVAGGTEVTLAGMIQGKAEAIVKSGRLAGKKMARFRLEEMRGFIQVTCFPKSYEEHRDLIEDGAVVAIRGKLEEHSEEPGLLLDEILDVEMALSRFSGGLVVSVGPEDRRRLAELKLIVDQHKGRQPLYILTRGEDGHCRRVRASNDSMVTISEDLAREIAGLIGEDRVRLARV